VPAGFHFLEGLQGANAQGAFGNILREVVMQMRKVLGLLLVLVLLLVVAGTATISADRVPTRSSSNQAIVPAPFATGAPNVVFLPVVMRSAAAIVIDHTMTDITKIPDYWLAQAKALTFHYAHTSHGSQLMTGARWWEGRNSTYNIDIKEGGASSLPPDATALRIYDGNNPDTYITPDLYWDGDTGKNKTRSVASTGLFNYSMWSWCGQQSSNSTTTVQEYLDTMNQFEQEYPAMRFIYMSGHTDGTGPGGTLFRNNDMVRQYIRDHGKVLFDFADIETYDPAGGGPYYNNGDGYCEWCENWCSTHSGYCDNFDVMDDCAHTHKLFCKLKGGAFWWMMARLAGWNGVP
jgi:hypothetical protein